MFNCWSVSIDDIRSFNKKHNKAFGGTLSNEETWKLAGITKVTFYKYKKELLQEMDVEEK